MRYAKIVLTESGECVTATHLVLGQDKKEVAKKATERLRQHIDEVAREHPQAAPTADAYQSALKQGYWWTDLDSDQFTVMVLEPEQIELAPLLVKDELTRCCGLVLDLADEEVHTRYQCARSSYSCKDEVKDAQQLEADVNAARPRIEQMPQMLGLLSQAVHDWPQFDSDDEVRGTDLVDWFGQWRDQARALLALMSVDQSIRQVQLPALRNHLDHGFVVLTHNPENKPDSKFEAWAYHGPLDFNEAASLCFGLGADPVAALDALNWHLQRKSD